MNHSIAGQADASEAGEPGQQSDDPSSPRSCARRPGTPQSTQFTFDLIEATHTVHPDRLGWLHDRVRDIASHLELTGELRIRLIDDDEMAAAHETYCSVSGTTDVITFHLTPPGDSRRTTIDTDVLVCVDEAQRQSDQRGHSPEHEMLLYILHALLHCLGEDDRDEESYQRMHRREDEILRAIGVGPLFDVSAEGGER
ncbi:MAG: rRNA maturation RNase YbeY [Planctomycetota bacterium]